MEGMVKIPFAYCCAEGGGDVRYCDCVNKNHGTAWSHPKDARAASPSSPVDGGAAFPSVCRDDPGHPASLPGMSLRDWFAGQALPGVIRMCSGDTRTREIGHNAYYAEAAYALADAMLAERAK